MKFQRHEIGIFNDHILLKLGIATKSAAKTKAIEQLKIQISRFKIFSNDRTIW